MVRQNQNYNFMYMFHLEDEGQMMRLHDHFSDEAPTLIKMPYYQLFTHIQIGYVALFLTTV